MPPIPPSQDTHSVGVQVAENPTVTKDVATEMTIEAPKQTPFVPKDTEEPS